MSFGIWVLVFAFVVTSVVGYIETVKHRAAEAAVIAYKAKSDAAQAKIDEQAKAIEAAAASRVNDMQLAYAAGEATAKERVRTIYVQGQANVVKDKGLSNPTCVMSDDSLHLLIGALTSMRTAAAPSGVITTMPGTGNPLRRDVQQPVPQLPSEHGAVGPVHEGAPAVDNPSQLPGHDLSAHPKPKPIR
jgi:hypothetical protein